MFRHLKVYDTIAIITRSCYGTRTLAAVEAPRVLAMSPQQTLFMVWLDEATNGRTAQASFSSG